MGLDLVQGEWKPPEEGVVRLRPVGTHLLGGGVGGEPWSVLGEGRPVQRPSGEEARGTLSRLPAWTCFGILLLS